MRIPTVTEPKLNQGIGLSFPKAARLLCPQEFRFRPFRKVAVEELYFIFSTQGSGRLGVSIAKRVLKSAAARNRVRRLIREVFRKNRSKFNGLDINVVGLRSLKEVWKDLGEADIQQRFEDFYGYVRTKSSRQALAGSSNSIENT